MSRQKSVTLWYPEYPGDYARKTAHLSMAQHGAYLLLRQHYYSTGRALPTNVTALYRICGAIEGSEQADVKAVLAEFFTLEDDGYHNSRCDEELSKRRDIRKKRQDAVNSRADRKPAGVPTIVDTPTTTPTVVKEGGGGSARGADPHDEILAAAGIDPTKDSFGKWYRPEQIEIVARWRAAGFSQAEILAEVRGAAAGRSPPSTLAYFERVFERALARRQSPPLQPASIEETHRARLPAPPTRAEQRSIDQTNAIIAGASRLPVRSR